MNYISDRELEYHRRPFLSGFADPDRMDSTDDRKARLEDELVEQARNNEQKEQS